MCTSQLTFSCPAPLHAYRAAEVTLTGAFLDLPTYYIDSRKVSGGTVSVTALDRMAYTDEPFPDETITYDNDKAQTSAVMDVIAQKCGFSGYSVSIPQWLANISKSLCEGRSCASILEDLSIVLCGYWYVAADNKLAFRAYGDSSGEMAVADHTALDIGDEYTAKGVRVTSEKNTYERGSTLYSYDTIQISSELGTDEAAADIWSRAAGKYYDSVSCSDCVMDFIPLPSCDVSFAQNSSRTYRIMDISARISCSGIIGSLSTSAPSGSEISRRGRIERSVDDKLTKGKKYGKARITAYQGIIYEEDDEEE